MNFQNNIGTAFTNSINISPSKIDDNWDALTQNTTISRIAQIPSLIDQAFSKAVSSLPEDSLRLAMKCLEETNGNER